MKQRFTEEELKVRISNFRTFIEKNKLMCVPDSKERNSIHPFLIMNGQQQHAKVSFTRMGNIYIVARPGMLKDLLLLWIKQERPNYKDGTSESNLEKLDRAFKDIQIPYMSSSFSLLVGNVSFPANSVRLMVGDSPLVELAELLGYKVYRTDVNASVEQKDGLSYSVISNHGNSSDGPSLVRTLADFIKQQLR